MSTHAWFPSAALLLASFAIGRAAHADPSSGEMVEKGIQLRREHRDAEALEQFRRADQLNPAPRIRAQIALAEQALAQWVEAEKDLHQALSAKDDPWIRDHADALGKALVTIQQHLGFLTIESNVKGSELWTNGARVGSLPMSTLRVVAGTVNVEVRAAGYETARRAVEVPPGNKVTERLELTEAPAPPIETHSELAPIPSADAVQAPSTQRLMAWGALGAAGAVLGGALAAQLVNQLSVWHYNDNAQCLKPYSGTRDDQCSEYRYRAQTAQTFAYIGYAGAGAFGIASAVLFLTAPPAPKRSAMWVDAQPTGVFVGWRGEL